MSFVLTAPLPTILTTMQMPDPDHGNPKGQDLNVDFKKSINNTRYTYVKSSARKTLTFTWDVLGRGKLVEVQEFYKNYAGDQIRLIDFRDNVWDVIFAENPIDITMNQRSGNAGGARFESGSLTLEFLGVKIS